MRQQEADSLASAEAERSGNQRVLMARRRYLYEEVDRILIIVSGKLRNPDTVHNLPSLRVERGLIDSVRARMEAADKLTQELLMVVTNPGAIQDEARRRRSQLDASIRELRFVIAHIEASIQLATTGSGAGGADNHVTTLGKKQYTSP